MLSKEEVRMHRVQLILLASNHPGMNLTTSCPCTSSAAGYKSKANIWQRQVTFSLQISLL